MKGKMKIRRMKKLRGDKLPDTAGGDYCQQQYIIVYIIYYEICLFYIYRDRWCQKLRWRNGVDVSCVETGVAVVTYIYILEPHKLHCIPDGMPSTCVWIAVNTRPLTPELGCRHRTSNILSRCMRWAFVVFELC